MTTTVVASRTAESFESIEGVSATLAGGTGFTTLGTFSGRPDSVLVRNFANGNIFVRFRDVVGPATSEVPLAANSMQEFRFGRRIVEARDAAGAGGQFVAAMARFIFRGPAIRENGQGTPHEP